MLEKIENIFKKEKILSIEDLKERLNIESAKEFVELVKNVGKLERKLAITQLPNEKFLYVKEALEIEGVIRLHQKGFAFVILMYFTIFLSSLFTKEKNLALVSVPTVYLVFLSNTF